MSRGVQKINDNPFLRISFAAVAGAGIAASISLLKPIWILLALFSFLVFTLAFLFKDVKLYWMTLFIFALQLDLKKNFLDGLRVLEDLHIDYLQFIFVPEIRLSDIPLIILCLVWMHNILFLKKEYKFPKFSWLAIGFLVWSGLSMLKAPSIYLSIVELLRQSKFFLIYLYAVNNIGSKREVKVVLVCLLMALMLQGTVTLVRYKLQYFEPLFGETFGRSFMSSAMQKLVINPSAGELKASFGTFPGAITSQFFLLLLPIALMACHKNLTFSRQWVFFPLFVSGALGLYVTYSRTSFVAFLVEIILYFYFSFHRGYHSRMTGLLLLVFVSLSTIIILPKLYDYIDRRNMNVAIRFEQYKIANSIILSNIILGVGLNNSTGAAKAYIKYSSSPIDPISQASDAPTHSFFLNLLIETGMVGFMLYMAFFICICREAWRLSRSCCDSEITFFATILLIAIIGLASGVLTNPLFDDPIQTLLWLYAGMIVACVSMEEADFADAARQ